MGSIKRGVFGLFVGLFLLVSIGFVNAEIIVNGPEQTAVNIGDDITISGYVLRTDDALGLLKFELVCGSEKDVLMVRSVSLKSGVKKDFSEEFAIVSLNEGNCNVDVSLDNFESVLEIKSSSNFVVTTALTGTVGINKENIQAGEEIKISGKSFKQDGTPVEGFAIITLKKEGGIYFSDSVEVEEGKVVFEINTRDVPGGEYLVTVEIRNGFGNSVLINAGSFVLINKIEVNPHTAKVHYLPKEKVKMEGTASVLGGKLKKGTVYVSIGEEKYEEDLRNGNFDLDFYLLNTITSGKQDINVRIEDEFGNFGTYTFSIIVDAIPSKITIAGAKEAINPGESMEIKAFLKDQAGEVIEDSITIKVENEDEDIFFDSVQNSGEQFTITLDADVEPGNYFIRGYYGNVEGEKIFVVGQVLKLEYSLDGQTLVVKNVGNIPYEGPLQIELESLAKTSSISDKLNLGVGQEERIDLGVGMITGTYDVVVNENSFEAVEIMGVKRMSYSWLIYVAVVWVIIMLWMIWKGSKKRLRKRIMKTMHSRNIVPKGKQGEYGGASMSRVISEEDHVKKYKAYMERVRGFKERARVNPVKKSGLFSRIFSKKQKVSSESLVVNNVFRGVKKEWTRDDGVRSYSESPQYQNRISNLDRTNETESEKKKKKDDDEPTGNMFSMFD